MTFEVFSKYPEIIGGLSEKSDGNMKLGALDSKINRERFFGNMEIPSTSILSARLVHNSRVKIVGKEDFGKVIEKIDGLITHDRGVVLTVTVADCVPIYFYDREKQVIAIAHGGWKGILNGIVLKTVTMLEESFGVNSNKLGVVLGPGIRKCHYEVQKDVAEKFQIYPSALFKQEKTYLDLSEVIRLQLIGKGLREENVTTGRECTYEDDSKFFSYRRDRPEQVAAMVAYIGFRN